MLFSLLVGSALIALVIALAIKFSCKVIYGASPSYGNAWLASFAGAVAGAVITPLLITTTGLFMAGPLSYGVVAFFVQVLVFKKVVKLSDGRELSFGESSVMALVAALMLVVLMPLAKVFAAFSLMFFGSLFAFL